MIAPGHPRLPPAIALYISLALSPLSLSFPSPFHSSRALWTYSFTNSTHLLTHLLTHLITPLLLAARQDEEVHDLAKTMMSKKTQRLYGRMQVRSLRCCFF
jgi:hypothetical protein